MKTILYAEDDANDMALIRMALKGVRGINLQFVRDGAEAINYLAGEGRFANRSRHPMPDLIFLDIKMPRLSGFDVLEWRHERAQLAKVPVVMLTSSGQGCDVDTAHRLGANSYIVKPCGFEELRAALLDAIKFHVDETVESA